MVLTLAALAMSLLSILSPMAWMACVSGPMKVTPSAACRERIHNKAYFMSSKLFILSRSYLQIMTTGIKSIKTTIRKCHVTLHNSHYSEIIWSYIITHTHRFYFHIKPQHTCNITWSSCTLLVIINCCVIMIMIWLHFCSQHQSKV